MGKLKAVVEISRPVNCLITFFSIAVSAYICGGSLTDVNLYLAGFAGALTAAGGNIINDIFDIKIDRINKPHRPLPSEKLKKSEANNLYLLFNLTALVIGATIGIKPLIIVFVTISLIFFYSFYLKQVVLIGNLLIASLTALAFIFGGVVAGDPVAAIIPAGFAFMINLIREILKDVEDLEGDIEHGVMTLSTTIGIKNTLYFTFLLTGLLIILTTIPYFTGMYNLGYFVIVMLTVNLLLIYFIKIMSGKITVKKIARASALLKLTMLFGLAAIIVGVS